MHAATGAFLLSDRFNPHFRIGWARRSWLKQQNPTRRIDRKRYMMSFILEEFFGDRFGIRCCCRGFPEEFKLLAKVHFSAVCNGVCAGDGTVIWLSRAVVDAIFTAVEIGMAMGALFSKRDLPT